MNKALRPLLISLSLALLTACTSNTTPAPDPNTPVQFVNTDGTTMSVQGNALTLTAGDVTHVNWLSGAAWTSDNPSVLSVQQDASTTTVSAVGSGDAVLHGVYSGTTVLKVDLRVTVKSSVTGVKVTPSSATLNVGGTQALSASVSGKGNYSSAVTWQSSNTNVATVSSGGLVTALSAGSATITATSTQDTTKSASASIGVTTAAPTSSITGVSVTPGSANLNVGATQTLTSVVSGTGGFNASVTWKSSNTAVATVSSTGLVTAVAAGSATITATSTQDSTKSGSASITVAASVPASTITGVSVTPASATLNVGATQALTGTVSGTGSYSTGLTWKSSNTAVATVNTSGLVTALSAGSATITATSTQDTTKSASAGITVNPPPTTADPFNITLVFPASDGLTATQRQAFQTAAARWEKVIAAGLPDVPGVPVGGNTMTVDDVAIEASGIAIDGVGGVLGQAGPRYVRSSGLPLTGQMQFDSADLANMEANGTLVSVIMHEMGHVLGIGTLWSKNVQMDASSCSAATSVKYTGANGLSQYKALGGLVAWVPVEDQYSTGTKCGHWKESVFRTELMTGFASSGAMPLSSITVGALADLGYSVNYAAADPFTLPSATAQDLNPGQEIGERILTPDPVPFPGAK